MAEDEQDDLFDWAGVPELLLTFGDSGLGKTTDLAYLYPNGLFIAAVADGIRAGANVTGIRLRSDQVVEVRDLTGAFAVFRQVRDAQRAQGRKLYPGVGMDDLSILAVNELRRMQQSGDYDTKKANKYDMQIWVDLGQTMADLFSFIRYDLDMGVGVTSHKKEPGDSQGTFYKGGPDMPFKKLIRLVPHLATASYLCSIDSSVKGEHKGIYQCDQPSHEWHMKCRLGWTGQLPMNMAEICRQAPNPRPIPRHPDVDWIEPWVKGVFNALIEGKSGVAESLAEKLAVKKPNAPKQHIDWIMRDAIARVLLKKKRDGGTLASRWGV